MSKKPNYAWDSSVFLAWLGEEAGAPLADIAAVAQQIDDGYANLIVSVTAYAEVLEARHSREQMEKFRPFLKRSNVVVFEVTLGVAEKVQGIRSKGLAENRKIKTADAQHMATAILCKADVLHSLDARMLSLDAHAIVDGLRIKRPVLHDGQTVWY
jgi:predicted nucleic acid-binding protein